MPIPLLARLDDLPADAPFTRQDAEAAGVSALHLHRLTEAGHLRRMMRGIYVASDLPDCIELRCRGLALGLPEDAFICDRTAAWLYRGVGSLGPNEHLSVPEISYFRPSKHRRTRGLPARSGERAVIDDDLHELHGLRITTELRTALDLGRLQPTADSRLWGMDNMLASGAFTLDELLEQIPRFRGERGVVDLRILAPWARPGSQSFGESATRLRWRRAGLPDPVLQYPVRLTDGTTYFLDMADPELLFAAEYDGGEWHSSPEQREHDGRRRARIRDEDGWLIEVLTKVNVFGRDQDAETRLRRVAREARATLGLRRWHL